MINRDLPAGGYWDLPSRVLSLTKLILRLLADDGICKRVKRLKFRRRQGAGTMLGDQPLHDRIDFAK